MEGKIIRAALYERVSTEEQEKHGYSIAAQIDALEEYSHAYNYKIVDHYTDAGVSGGKSALKRPQMSRLIDDIKAGKIDIVLFTKLDRWFRNVQEYFKMQEILDKHKIEWKTIHEDYDTTSANGRFAIQVMLSIAQHERERGSERIKATFKHKLKNKEACFGGLHVPLGYKKERDESGVLRYVYDEETKPIMDDFWQLMKDGNSVQGSGKIINEKYNMTYDMTTWHRIFKNSLYRGEKKGIPDYCVKYIEPEEYEKIDIRKAIRKTEQNRCYLFIGLLVCPECGRRLTSNYKREKNKEYYQYRCRHTTDGTCSYNKYIAQIKTEKWLLSNIKPQLEKYIASVSVADVEATPKKHADTKRINEKIRRLNVVYMSGAKSDEEYSKELTKLKNQLEEATREEKENAPRDLSPLKQFLELDFEKIYHTLEDTEKRQLWRSVINKIHVNGNSVDHVDFKT